AAGQVVAAAYLLALLAVPVRAFGWVLGELPRALVGYERIARVVDAGGMLTEGTTRPGPSDESAHIELRGLTVEVAAPGGAPALCGDSHLDPARGRSVPDEGQVGAGQPTLAPPRPRLVVAAQSPVVLEGADTRAVAPLVRTFHIAAVGHSAREFERDV